MTSATQYIFFHMKAYDLSKAKPDKPHWCIAWYDEVRNNTVFLNGKGFDHLTQAEAKQKADELNQKLR